MSDAGRSTRVAEHAIANTLSRHLARRSWSDLDLARTTGLTRVRVNRLKNRHARPTVGEALRIGAALDVRISQIFSLVAPPRASTRLRGTDGVESSLECEPTR